MTCRALFGVALGLLLASSAVAAPRPIRVVVPTMPLAPLLLLQIGPTDDVGSRPVTVQVSLFGLEPVDVGSRPVTVQVNPAGSSALDVGSRTFTVQVDTVGSGSTDFGSRAVTVQVDSFANFEVASRLYTVDGNAPAVLNVTYGGIDPMFAPTTVQVVIRSPLPGVDPVTLTLTPGEDFFWDPDTRLPFDLYIARTGTWLGKRHALDLRDGEETFVWELINGDIDGDNVIDLQDFLILAANYEAMPFSDPRADLNQDGVVNLDDFLILAANYEIVGD